MSAINEAELRNKLVIIFGNAIFSGKSLAQVNKMTKAELEKVDRAVDEALDLYRENERAVRLDEDNIIAKKFDDIGIHEGAIFVRREIEINGALSNTHKTGEEL